MIEASSGPKVPVVIDTGTRGDRVVISLTAPECSVEARLSIEEAINMATHLDQSIEVAKRMAKTLRGGT
jgi:hypothetical protein